MKLRVEKIAKIDKAEIKIKDLTVFVGKNSTNKSYMAHTIYILNKVLSKFTTSPYGSSNYSSQLLNEYLKEVKTKSYIEELQNIDKYETVKDVHVQTGEDDYQIEVVREVMINLNKFDLNELIIDMEKFIFERIIKLVSDSFNVNRKILEKLSFNTYENRVISILNDGKIVIRHEDEKTDHLVLLNKIFRQILSDISEQKISEKEFYFPASRTGFVLAFDEIVSGVLRDRFGGQPTATKLTEPTIDFISAFADIKSGKFDDDMNPWYYLFDDDSSPKKSMRKLFEFIENRIIKGKIIEDKQSQNYMQFYLQTNNRERLDLHLSSSATVELLPLIIFLKHFSRIDNRLLVIEEPEAHLHPKAQIEIARLLVMLSNAGAKVLITTHSDYILNELSNCIKLSNATDNKREEYLEKYKLDEDIVISSDRVSAYLFKDIDNKKTEVQELTIDEYGIANDNFDDILDELLERSDEINGMVL